MHHTPRVKAHPPLPALGVSTLYFSSIPASRGFFAGTSARVALSYSSVGLALNVACTSLICARILAASRALRRALSSENEVARAYTGAAAVVVESMLPYTLFGALYVGTLGADSPLSILFLSLYAMFNVRLLRFRRSEMRFRALTRCASWRGSVSPLR